LATLTELARADGSRALAVLGDMLELGDEAARAHAEVGQMAGDLDVAVIALGEHAAALAGAGAPGDDLARVAASPDEAAAFLLSHTAPGDWVLVKGSRGMRLERVIDAALVLVSAQERPSGET